MSTMTSASKQDRIQKARENFSVALESALPMTHFSQFYDGLEFDKLAQQQAKKCLAKFQEDSSEFDMHEIGAVTNELIQRFQEIIEQWKVKNEENKTECKHFLQGQVDFLLSDFRTSVMIQLILAPDVGLQELETFLEGRKIVLIDIFEKLSKPGEPQSLSIVDMKRMLKENLECLKKETLEKQRLLLEQKAINNSQKVLESFQRRIIKIAMQLKSDLNAYQGKTPKVLLKGKLAEINYILSMEGKELHEYHPNIYSALLRTTAEVEKCLYEKEYKDMSAVEFAETLHEQLLFDFAGGDSAGLNPCAMELDSISSSDESASEALGNKEELLTAHDVSENYNNEREQQPLPNELQFNSAVEEGVKAEKDDEVDYDKFEMDLGSSSDESALKSSEDDGGVLKVERGNEVEESTTPVNDNLQSSFVNLKKSNKRVFYKNIGRSRRSARLQLSSQTVTEKGSRQKPQCIAAEAKKRRDDNISGRRDGDSTAGDNNKDTGRSSPKSLQPCSSKSKPNANGRKLLHDGRQRLTKDEDRTRTSADKITYLHLQRGIPYYRCNVCQQKCRQGLLRYHGEFCGTSDDPLACKECGKAFLSRGGLEMHSRVHTGEKPFKCLKCPTRFTQHGAMLRHMRSHETASRFLCKLCKLVFVSTKELHVHNKTKHLGKLPFGCFYCDRRFRRLDELKAHVIVHTDERPYQCPTCGIDYAIREVFRRHLNSVHNRSRQTTIKLANQSAIDYLRREMKDQSFGRSDIVPASEINLLVASHIIKKAKLRIPGRTA